MADVNAIGGVGTKGVKKPENDQAISSELQDKNKTDFDEAGKDVKGIRKEESTGDILRRNGLDDSEAKN